MKENTRSLQGDFSHLSLQDLEDMVGKYMNSNFISTLVENELDLHKSFRQLKNRARSLSKEQVDLQRELVPEPKKVYFIESESQMGP